MDDIITEQDQIEAYDSILATRTVSDAGLIASGANYYHGQLMLTDSQIESIRQSHPATAKKVGFLTLRNPVEESLVIPIDNLILQNQNREQLGNLLNVVTDPYAGVFNSYVPSASLNKRTIFGNLKRSSGADYRIGQMNVPLGRITAGYDFSPTYNLGNEENALTRMTMRIGDESHTFTSPRYELVCNYQTGALTRMDFKTEYFTEDVDLSDDLLRLLLQLPPIEYVLPNSLDDRVNQLGKFLTEYAPQQTMLTRIDVSSENPSITVYATGSDYPDSYSPNLKIDCQYVYNAARDNFQLVGKDHFRSHFTDLDLTHRASHLTNQQFADIISGTLSLIPAK